MPTNTHTNTATNPAARFGTAYGYRFNGDNVELHASFQLLNETVHQLQWSMQLRAGQAGNGITEPRATLLVAEASLPPFAEITDISEPFFLTTTATPPAGSGEFNLYLMLVAKNAKGLVETQDVAFFDHPERFCQPRFNGEISHQITGSNIQLNVTSIENPRDPANLTGTLSLELWALANSYAGGAFEGTGLAGVTIGYLAGQQSTHHLTYNLDLTTPPPGRWHLVLMLREWTGNGFTTRDYFNFTLPLEIAAPAPAKPEPIVQPETPAPVVAKPTPALKEAAPEKKPASPAKPKKPAATTNKPAPAQPARSTKRSGKK